MPASMAGKFSETITAEAFVIFAAALYLGLETNVNWPCAAFSMPATPVISVSGKRCRGGRLGFGDIGEFHGGIRENCSKAGLRS